MRLGYEKKSSRARKCPICGLPAIKHARTAAGAQRWRCKPCSFTFTATRSDTTPNAEAAQFEAFIRYVTGKFSKNDLAELQGVSRSTLARRLDWCWQIPTPPVESTGEIYDQIFLDGIYLNEGWTLLCGVNNHGFVVAHQWATSENAPAYKALLTGLAPPLLVTVDGASGGLKAIKDLWGSEDTLLQRCLLHVHRNNIRDLTMNPRTEAGKALLALSRGLKAVRDKDQTAKWATGLAAFHTLHKDWINDKTLAKDHPEEAARRGRKNFWYTHERDHRVYQRLNHLYKNGTLFNFLTLTPTSNKEFQPFTNRAESINSLLHRGLKDHRGLSTTHMQIVLEWILYVFCQVFVGRVAVRKSAVLLFGYFMSAWVTRHDCPLKRMRCPWWMSRSMIAAAMLSSAKMLPHFENSMLVVMMRLVFS